MWHLWDTAPAEQSIPLPVCLTQGGPSWRSHSPPRQVCPPGSDAHRVLTCICSHILTRGSDLGPGGRLHRAVAFPQSPVVGGVGDERQLSGDLGSPPLNHDRLPAGDSGGARNGARKWLHRWGVGGSSQHMGLRGRKESGPGMREGAQGCGDGPRSRDPRWSGGGRVNWTERGGGNSPKVGAGEWGRPWMRSSRSLWSVQHAERLAQERPLMAVLASDTVSIFFSSV